MLSTSKTAARAYIKELLPMLVTEGPTLRPTAKHQVLKNSVYKKFLVAQVAYLEFCRRLNKLEGVLTDYEYGEKCTSCADRTVCVCIVLRSPWWGSFFALLHLFCCILSSLCFLRISMCMAVLSGIEFYALTYYIIVFGGWGGIYRLHHRFFNLIWRAHTYAVCTINFAHRICLVMFATAICACTELSAPVTLMYPRARPLLLSRARSVYWSSQLRMGQPSAARSVAQTSQRARARSTRQC